MKNLTILTIFLFLGTWTNQVIAQETDPNATKLMDAAKSKLESLDAYQFDFSLIVHRDNEDSEQLGTYTSMKEKYLIETNGMRLMSDGTYSYAFKNDNKDIEIYDIDKSSQEIDLMKGPSSILSFYQTETFIYQIVSMDSEPTHMIAFKPKDKDGGIVKIVLSISKNNDLEYCQIFMRDATNYLLKIKSFKANPNIDSGLFVYDLAKYPGANVEDLRLD